MTTLADRLATVTPESMTPEIRVLDTPREAAGFALEYTTRNGTYAIGPIAPDDPRDRPDAPAVQAKVEAYAAQFAKRQSDVLSARCVSI